MLVGIHESLRLWTGAPEFQMDLGEAGMLAAAGGKVARWYQLPNMAQKTMDWANFAMCLNVVYTPRVIAARIRWKNENAMRVAAAKSAAANRGVPAAAVPHPRPDDRIVSPGPVAASNGTNGGPSPGAPGGPAATGAVDPADFGNDPRMFIPSGDFN